VAARPSSTFDPHGGSARTATTELLAFARRAHGFLDGGEVLDALLEQAAAMTGAAHAAVLERTALDGLKRLRDHESGLPEHMAIGDVRAQLWGVLLGRTQLVWDDPDVAPTPFRDLPGWGTGIVVRIAARRGPTKLLALGGPGDVGPAAVELVQGLADIAAPTIEGLDLASATRRSHALLRGVTDLAGNLGAAVSPGQLLEAIASGLCSLDGIAGARVWAADEGDGGRPVVVAGGDHGDVPDSPAVEVRVRRLLDPRTGRAVRSLVESPARFGPGTPLLTLLTLSSDPARVLGILHHQPLDDLSQGVLASLATAIGPAMREVEMAAERRSLLSGYTSALRPSTRPQGVELAVEHHPNTSAPGSFGGDFYDWFEVGDDHAVIALGDVSGKGISAASAASMVVWSLRAIGGRGAQPTVISHLLNGVVAQELDADRFVTLALLTVDTAAWDARLLLSGHPAPLLVGDGVAAPLDCQAGPPLGVSAVTSGAPPMTISLAPGEALVLYTDGVTDAASSSGLRYGEARLAERAARLAAGTAWSAKSLAAGLWQSVHAWAGGPPDDDCAILVVRRPA
jgi:sigma-B regulation protein RsbU (phosphoserine phosphatase)